jgi:hypothetical protein
MQVPLQLIRPDWQESAQAPAEQTFPTGQTVLQLPQ